LAWGTEVSDESLVFPSALAALAPTADDFVAAALRHVRFRAPELNAPFKTPRIEFVTMNGLGGQFIEDDGWVKIIVRSRFADDLAASRAILCHELCHYVLSASGIREPDTEENERLTDVAMFVFGLGEIFCDGYKRDALAINRTGHRLA
jgi:hypothetical protein